jgi:uncharacterized protein YndB with AHSA1/START domain
MYRIKHQLVVNRPLDVVYKALTEQEGLSSWWTEETIASPQKGSTAEFKFGDRYHNKMRVVELIRNRSVRWECLQGDPEWVGTTLTFDLEDVDGKTIVRFCHGNWRAETDFLASCNTHWGYYMRSLKSYCETGVGTPFRDEQGT